MNNPWGLSVHQAKVVHLLVTSANGCNKVIAKTMGISNKTVESHLARVFEKMGVTNRIQVALTWDRWIRSQ